MANLGYIQLTRRCNQHCIICSNPENENTLSLARAKKEIDDLIKEGYDGIIFSGGEPTLYPELLPVIAYCKKKKISARIITNGQRTADLKFTKGLAGAGLDHVHLSIYSYKPRIQAKLSQNKDSFANIQKSLENFVKLDITVDINTAINKYNADHLSRTVRWVVKNYPFIRHFVFNNLDPYMNRASENADTIPCLNDFELELHRALEFLSSNKKTFRVERVPLCYLTDFEHVSTETRKIVKNENRAVYFLDQRGKVSQEDWHYKQGAKCQSCGLKDICAGLYGAGKFYFEEELSPVFSGKEEIIKKIRSEA